MTKGVTIKQGIVCGTGVLSRIAALRHMHARTRLSASMISLGVLMLAMGAVGSLKQAAPDCRFALVAMTSIGPGQAQVKSDAGLVVLEPVRKNAVTQAHPVAPASLRRNPNGRYAVRRRQ